MKPHIITQGAVLMVGPSRDPLGARPRSITPPAATLGVAARRTAQAKRPAPTGIPAPARTVAEERNPRAMAASA
jgi:hypothetical protein